MDDKAIHLVLGDTAAGVLRDAMRGGTPAAAAILRFRDIYCLGPLGALGTADGPASRARYWAELLPEAPPAVAEFDEEEARYLRDRFQATEGKVPQGMIFVPYGPPTCRLMGGSTDGTGMPTSKGWEVEVEPVASQGTSPS